MDSLVFLSLATVVIIVLCLAIWRVTGYWPYLIGIGFFYYFALFGAWTIIMFHLGQVEGGKWLYLNERIVSLQVDKVYFESLMLYTLFIIAIQIGILINGRPTPTRFRIKPISFQPLVIIIIGLLCSFSAYYFVGNAIDEASQSGMSAYAYTRRAGTLGNVSTLFSVLNETALLSFGFLVALYLTSHNGKYFKLQSCALGYLLVAVCSLAILVYHNFLLGNKNPLFFMLLSSLLLYTKNSINYSRTKLIGFALTAIVLVATVDVVRGIAAADFASELGTMPLDKIARGVTVLYLSNEQMGAHFSLYAVLINNVEPIFGYSIYSLAVSSVPRILWPDRPGSIYDYYAEQIGAVSGQGYSIHHATGWFLNFGYFGILAGGLLFGLLWGFFTRKGDFKASQSTSTTGKIFFLVFPTTLVASIPNLSRAGIEAYKGVVVQAVLEPLLILGLASFFINLGQNRRS